MRGVTWPRPISYGMKATAKLRYLRMAPRKVRMAVDLVRGKKVVEAQLLLQFAAKHSALPVLKTLNSAVASAINNFQAEAANLYISHIAVNEGPKLKRFRPRARGQAYEIQKKTSHITIVVDEIEQEKVKKTTKSKDSVKDEKSVESVDSSTQKKETKKTYVKDRQSTSSRPKEQRGVQRFFRRKAI